MRFISFAEKKRKDGEKNEGCHRNFEKRGVRSGRGCKHCQTIDLVIKRLSNLTGANPFSTGVEMFFVWLVTFCTLFSNLFSENSYLSWWMRCECSRGCIGPHTQWIHAEDHGSYFAVFVKLTRKFDDIFSTNSIVNYLFLLYSYSSYLGWKRFCPLMGWEAESLNSTSQAHVIWGNVLIV